MAVTAAAYVGAAVIAATAAFIGVVIGKEQKTTEFRQEWINAQRDDIATVLAKAINAKGLSGEQFSDALLAFDEAFNRIRLRENPEKKEWSAVLEALDRLRTTAFVTRLPVDLNFDTAPVVEISQALLKAEWTRVRAGESWFKAAKWLLPPAIFFVGVALAYGKGFIQLC